MAPAREINYMDALEGIVANPTNRVYQSNIRHVPCGVVTDGALKCPIYSRNNPTLAANIILIGLIEMATADKGYHIRERISILNTSGLFFCRPMFKSRIP